MMNTKAMPRLSIELKTPEEEALKDKARSTGMMMKPKTNLHDIVIKALSEFCIKNS